MEIRSTVRLIRLQALTVSILATTLPAFAQTAATPMQAEALVNKYCVSCHSERLKTGGLALEKLDFSKMPADAATWEKVIRKVRVGAMPPLGMPRPDKAALDGFSASIEDSIDRAAAVKLNPGRTLIHRLNRTEYANAIKDLLALDVDVSAFLPADDTADGFDNIAQALTLSPALLESYLSASAKVSALAVGDPSLRPDFTTYRLNEILSQDKHIDGLPLGTIGGILIHHNFPLDGEYSIEPKIMRTAVGIVRGMEDRHELEIAIDGKRLHTAQFGGIEEDTKSHLEATTTGNDINARCSIRLPIKAGPHTITVAFVRQSQATNADVWQENIRTTIDNNETRGAAHVARVNIIGPYNPKGAGDTPSRRRIFICRPATTSDDVTCARRILGELASKAYRRPAGDNDVEDLLSFYQRGRNESGNFEQGIEMALRRLISGPEFVFRVEADPPSVPPGTAYRISDLELASRLSFFLWSTIPDDQLLAASRRGDFKDPALLERQVRHMLADPHSETLVEDFAAQWLQLRNLKEKNPDSDVYPDFDDNLRRSMVRETELLFDSIIKEDRNVVDLLTANYTFLDERLAKHYGIPGIYGERFRRVELTDEARRGLLGQASILTLTSVANRTSPVVRGKWVLTNLMGIPPKPPPPNVPTLKEGKAGSLGSMRERMAAHRADAVCASCHKTMDPIGFTLENYDAVGRWRTSDGPVKIDANDSMFDGTKVDGVSGLRNFLTSRPEVFVQTFTENLMTYALGRPLDYYDMPAVRKIVRDAAQNNYRFSSVVTGIIRSVPFQMRMKPAYTESESAADVGKPSDVIPASSR
jgi:hypothetical protein